MESGNNIRIKTAIDILFDNKEWKLQHQKDHNIYVSSNIIKSERNYNNYGFSIAACQYYQQSAQNNWKLESTRCKMGTCHQRRIKSISETQNKWNINKVDGDTHLFCKSYKH